ncbi:2-octaprenyl-6-methoxyphenyl hydroxylase [Colwellia psychrerythraea]|uniref:2-polyprenyl-6-methoxyphenol 4-hydroxylase n=1 Tax=Colwellia psychrerythraea TaxID=28229 RepID=A0A099KPN8_COLPS|nr:2-octaprenyl-6-methoxyphenyl hydroxylase [Colwellia psychrerythraea]KGJ91897.1 2-polyprenyl-6-methoxyphenol 4-hydroxylase [Colwellia psychrerythraea]
MENFKQNFKQNTSQHFDVIISGGGLSGSLMALSLSKLTKADGSLLSIAIIETLAFKENSPANDNALFDARVLALSHGSAKYLAKLGAWQYLKDETCAITDIDISDRGHFAKARLTAKEYGVNALGYVIDMALIGKAQLKALAQNTKSNHNSNSSSAKNIHWFSPDSIADITWQDSQQEGCQSQDKAIEEKANQDKQQVSVTLNSGKVLSAQLLLGCDGVQSPVRKLAKIAVSCDDYQQVALIANVTTSKAHYNKAFERFTEFGPIAMLPLNSVNSSSSTDGKSRCSLVWTMTPEQAQEIQKLDDDAFKIELERAFGSYLGAITHVGTRDTYPLVLLQAQQQTYHRMALIGNASHTIHPIAGQGFNLGLRDVQVMTELVAKALVTNKDIGNFALLHNYQVNRAKDQREVIQLTDSLVTLFANDLPPLVVGRNIGLQALNIISPLKSALVKKTMGY